MTKGFLETTIKRFRKYIRKMRAENNPRFNDDLADEVDKRLIQLEYLYKNISKKELRYSRLNFRLSQIESEVIRSNLPKKTGIITIPNSDEVIEMKELWIEIELFTETFYYIAHRVMKILQNRDEPLPLLKTFKCKGVRDVRNHLLEHPEGSKILMQSFGIGGEKGPTLKIQRVQTQETIFPDAGFYENAQEFKDNFDNLLNLALNDETP